MPRAERCRERRADVAMPNKVNKVGLVLDARGEDGDDRHVAVSLRIEDEGTRSDSAGESEEERTTSTSAPKPKSSSEDLEAFQAEILFGLEEELSASKARSLELQYHLEKSEERVKEQDVEILELTSEVARLRTDKVDLEQKLVAAQAKELPRTPTKRKGGGSAADEEKESLTRQLSKAERALEQERRIASELRRELEDHLARASEAQAKASAAPEPPRDAAPSEAEAALRTENEALKSRIAQVEEKTSLVHRTLSDSNAQCAAASSTIDKLITENVEYIERINHIGIKMREAAESRGAAGKAGQGEGAEFAAPLAVEMSAEAPAMPALQGKEGRRQGGESPLVGARNGDHHDPEDPPPPMKERKYTGFFGFIAGADLVN